MSALLQAAQTDWTVVSILIAGITACATVIGILWWRYNQARDKYEQLLQDDRDDLVPAMVKLADVAQQLNASSTKLLEESIKLRTYRRGEGATGDSV